MMPPAPPPSPDHRRQHGIPLLIAAVAGLAAAGFGIQNLLTSSPQGPCGPDDPIVCLHGSSTGYTTTPTAPTGTTAASTGAADATGSGGLSLRCLYSTTRPELYYLPASDYGSAVAQTHIECHYVVGGQLGALAAGEQQYLSTELCLFQQKVASSGSNVYSPQLLGCRDGFAADPATSLTNPITDSDCHIDSTGTRRVFYAAMTGTVAFKRAFPPLKSLTTKSQVTAPSALKCLPSGVIPSGNGATVRCHARADEPDVTNTLLAGGSGTVIGTGRVACYRTDVAHQTPLRVARIQGALCFSEIIKGDPHVYVPPCRVPPYNDTPTFDVLGPDILNLRSSFNDGSDNNQQCGGGATSDESYWWARLEGSITYPDGIGGSPPAFSLRSPSTPLSGSCVWRGPLLPACPASVTHLPLPSTGQTATCSVNVLCVPTAPSLHTTEQGYVSAVFGIGCGRTDVQGAPPFQLKVIRIGVCLSNHEPSLSLTVVWVYCTGGQQGRSGMLGEPLYKTVHDVTGAAVGLRVPCRILDGSGVNGNRWHARGYAAVEWESTVAGIAVNGTPTNGVIGARSPRSVTLDCVGTHQPGGDY